MITGRCACGAVTYECTAEPLAQLICHCDKCQRISGSIGMPVMVVPQSAFSVSGPIRCHVLTGGSGMPAGRNACAECGSILFGTPEHAPEIITIYAGSLDDRRQFRPTFAQFVKDRPSWLGRALSEHAGRAP